MSEKDAVVNKNFKEKLCLFAPLIAIGLHFLIVMANPIIVNLQGTEMIPPFEEVIFVITMVFIFPLLSVVSSTIINVVFYFKNIKEQELQSGVRKKITVSNIIGIIAYFTAWIVAATVLAVKVPIDVGPLLGMFIVPAIIIGMIYIFTAVSFSKSGKETVIGKGIKKSAALLICFFKFCGTVFSKFSRFLNKRKWLKWLIFFSPAIIFLIVRMAVFFQFVDRYNDQWGTLMIAFQDILIVSVPFIVSGLLYLLITIKPKKWFIVFFQIVFIASGVVSFGYALIFCAFYYVFYFISIPMLLYHIVVFISFMVETIVMLVKKEIPEEKSKEENNDGKKN